MHIRSLRAVFAASSLVLTGAGLSGAVSWHDVQLSGFLSQGYLQSSANDYLGTRSSEGDFAFREYGLTANHRFGGQWRIGAQVFGQELGRFGNDRLLLDWGIIDYNFSQAFGVRAGRVKLPRGLYNEAIDLDAARVFVLLPQSIYDARLRDFQTSFDGAMVYGNIAAGRGGSFDYRLFHGTHGIDDRAGVSDFFNDGVAVPYTGIAMDRVWGGTLFWNAPSAALRVGYSYSNLHDLRATQDYSFMFPGAFVRVSLPDGYERHLLSAEYIAGDWTFAVEASRDGGALEVANNLGAPSGPAGRTRMDLGYASIARRLNARWELGAYQSRVVRGTEDKRSQADTAFSVRCDLSPHLLVKVEGHFVRGTALLSDTPYQPQPAAQRDESWSYWIAKTTLFF